MLNEVERKQRLAELEYERKQICEQRGIPYFEVQSIDLIASMSNLLLSK